MIERAELLVSCDEHGSVIFLTNAALHSSQPIENGLEFARLQSPSQLIKISFEQLKQANEASSVAEAIDFITEKGICWQLACESDQMIFLRTESYNFPRIKSTIYDKEKGIALQFYGAERRPPVLLYLSLIQREPEH